MSAKKQQSGKPKSVSVVKPPAKEKSESKPVPSFFDRPGRQVWYVLVGLLALVAIWIFKDYLLFDRLFLFKDIGSDTLNVFYPALMATSNYLRHYGTLSWSFNIGMGQDGTPLAFNDCLNVFLYLFPPSKMAWLLGYKEVFKIILAGGVFYTYLRTMKNTSFASFSGALMFAFSGYMIVGGEWYVFSFEALETALVLLGFELLFMKNIPWLLPLPIFLMGISSPFNLIPITIFLLIYTVFRYLQDNRKGIQGLLALFLKMAGLGLIGLAISTPFLFEHIKAMLESPRVSGTNSYFSTLSSSPVFGLVDPVQLGTCVNRFFSSDMLGTADHFKGFANYLEAPLFYCGIPCLLLVPLLFGYLDKREKKLFGVLLAIWLLPIFFPFFRLAFWLFSGDYYRTYSLYVALIFIVFSAACLSKMAKQKPLNIVLLIVVTASLILIQWFPYFDDKNILNPDIAPAAKIYVIVYAALLFWLSWQKSDLPKFVFLFVLVTELAWFSSVSVNRDSSIRASEWNDKTGYNDYTVNALAFIKSRDSSFYRIDKPVGSSPAENLSLNDGMVQDYYGTSCYSSFNQKYYIRYLLAYNIIDPKNESQSRWSVGLKGRPILQSINSVKYMLTKVHLSSQYRPGYDSLASFGDEVVYKNSFALPLGFCYEAYIKYSDFEKASTIQKDFISLRAAVVGDSDISAVRGLKQFDLKDTISPMFFNLDVYRDGVNSLRKDTLKITHFSPTLITGDIALKSARLLYLSIPYDIGWHLEVDGKPHAMALISNGMIGVALGQGMHQLELSYEPPYRKDGILLSVAGLLLYGGLMYSFYKRRGKKPLEHHG